MASITLRKGDPFEAVIIEMVETHRRKGEDYDPDASSSKGLYASHFDEVAREIPLEDYDAVMDLFTVVVRKTKRLAGMLKPGSEVDETVKDDTAMDLSVYAAMLVEHMRRPEDARTLALRTLGVPGA